MRRIVASSALAGVVGAALALAAGLDELPPDLAAAYQNVDAGQPVGPSADRYWMPRYAPPWTIGHASSYAGHTWRAER